MTWKQLLLELLCRIYELMDGDCADIGVEPKDKILGIATLYAKNGLPNFPTQADRDKFIDAIKDLQAHLQDPANNLGIDDKNALAALLASICADLGIPST